MNEERELFGLERPVFTFTFLPPGPQSDAMTVELHRVCEPGEAHGMLEQLIELAKKAWDDVKYDRIAPEVEEARVMDAIKESDVLNVKDAPKVN